MLTFLKRWLPVLLILAGLAVFFYFDLSQFMNFTQLKSQRVALLAWTESHYAQAVIIFILVYILAVAICIPGAVFFTIISGFLFGVFLGTLYVVVSATIGAMCVFLSVKTALEPWISKKTNHWINKMRIGFQKGAFQYLIFLRLAPIFPFWVVNIVPSLLGVRTSTFFLTTFIGIIPGSFVYVLLGNGLGQILNQNKTPNLSILFTPSVFTPLVALALLSLLPTLLKWKKGNQHE